MNETLDTILNRFSARKYKNKPLEREMLEEFVSAGLAAPWAFHTYSRHLTVISGRENVQKLADVIGKTLSRPNYDMYSPEAVILVCCEKGNDNQKLECGCVLQNIFLAAKARGVGSCWINQLRDICDVPEVRKAIREFGVPDTHIVWGMAILGYADGEPKLSRHCEGTYNIYEGHKK